MRSLWLVILALVALAGPALAQDAPPAFDVQPPRIGQNCQSMKPVAGADLAVYESPLCAITFEVQGNTDTVIWWLDGVEAARGGTYVYVPTNDTDYLIYTHTVQASGVKVNSPDSVESFTGDLLKVEVVNPPAPMPQVNNGQNVCSWLDDNLAGTCSKVLDNLVGLLIGGILTALGTVFLF